MRIIIAQKPGLVWTSDKGSDIPVRRLLQAQNCSCIFKFLSNYDLFQGGEICYDKVQTIVQVIIDLLVF